MPSDVRRKLTTILAADAEGYSRLMATDEVRGVGALRSARSIFARLIDRHDGRIANTAGDGLIADFPSVVEAVQCAVEIQNELSGTDGDSNALQFRIGIHLGDVILDGDDLLGEGVNLAARLQSMAPPGGILISRPVYDQVHAKLAIGFDYVGERRPKNFSQDVSVYSVTSRANVARVSPRVRVEPAPDPGGSPPGAAQLETPENGPRYYAKRLGLLWGGLVAIDILSGAGFWAHYPGIVMLGILGWLTAPPDGWRGIGVWTSRAIVVTGALALMNLATWDGTLWVVWPAGALIMLGLWRRMARAAG